MNFLPVSLIVGLTVIIIFFAIRKIFPELVRKKAIKKLERILFPEGYQQKAEVIRTFRQITGERFSDNDVLDYFLKIKGLQTVDINIRTNFWLKRYLFSPTAIKLNYFEQVRFYETFLNFPTPDRSNSQTPYNQAVKKDKTQIFGHKNAVQMSKPTI